MFFLPSFSSSAILKHSTLHIKDITQNEMNKPKTDHANADQNWSELLDAIAFPISALIGRTESHLIYFLYGFSGTVVLVALLAPETENVFVVMATLDYNIL